MTSLWPVGRSPFEDAFAAEEQRGLLVTVLDSRGVLLSRQLQRGIKAPDLPPRTLVRMDFREREDGAL